MCFRRCVPASVPVPLPSPSPHPALAHNGDLAGLPRRSDWGATHSTSINQGLDQEMPSANYMGASLAAAVQAGNVSVATVNNSVLNILVRGRGREGYAKVFVGVLAPL